MDAFIPLVPGDDDVVLNCPDPQSVAERYIAEYGYRLDLIFPADDPRCVRLNGNGHHLWLLRESASMARQSPRAGAVVAVARKQGAWVQGRAGMQYRDLVPGRMGGTCIASHIRITEGGPVPDYVHYHDVHFQLIYCYKGWVRVVYEDQGDPFVMHAGDCVLQPPGIRHRVLECAPGLEVVEVTSPAEHVTRVDHELKLPTGRVDVHRDFGGQQFVRFERAEGRRTDAASRGFCVIDTGIADASVGHVAAVIIERDAIGGTLTVGADCAFCFLFVLTGRCHTNLGAEPLGAGDSLAVAGPSSCILRDASAEFSALFISSPARATTRDRGVTAAAPKNLP